MSKNSEEIISDAGNLSRSQTISRFFRRPERLDLPLYVIAFFFLLSFAVASNPLPTPAATRLKAKTIRDSLKQNSLVKHLPFRAIGPTVMSGRAVDIDANPQNPTEFYVAYASGGLWYTKDNGISFKPLFDHQTVMSIGDIAVDWQHGGTLWVGTGENNSSRSSYSGNGIYKSVDSGKTWQHLGLDESHHIGRIVIDPRNPDVVWIAALGHLYSSNKERGVYKTTDGGKSWKKVLYLDENTGAVDLVLDPTNPDILYAAMWERTRRAWNFIESGTHSGIYKTTDGGQHWQKLNTRQSGFPSGKGVGRIGLAIYPQNPQILYAFLDNQLHRKKEETYPLTKNMLRTMSTETFLKLKKDDINDFLDRYHFPVELNADTLFQLVKKKTIRPVALVRYLEDANAQLFETPVIGAEVYRSDDGGQTWYKTHKSFLDKMVYTFGYYFGQIRVDSHNADHIFVLGVPLVESTDGGKTFTSINAANVHVDHHALWIDPGNVQHLISGNDGGLNISYDGGKTWLKTNPIPVGQFYTVAVDMATPFNVYGGLQDNGVWVGPGTHKINRAWENSGHYPFKSIMGGDGMQVAVDTRDNTTVYTGYQFGNYYRVNKNSGHSVSITPKHVLGQRPWRFNWQTPIHLSVHNQDILYLGSQKLHRSMDRGEHWRVISPDLTRGGRKGDVPYGTLTTIHESPLQFGLIYTGSDDGLIYVTRDGGFRWQRISDTLPQNFWISRIQASGHDTATVYAALNGYRWDNFQALIYKSVDYGQHWQEIGLDLPPEPVNVIKEDIINPAILYVGTDHGLYVSLDDGRNFMAFAEGLPEVAVHDLVVHPRDHKLIVATHGRSLFEADVSALQLMDSTLMQESLHLFKLPSITHSSTWGQRTYAWKFGKVPKLNIVFYSKNSGKSRIRIRSEKGTTVRTFQKPADSGLNYVEYDLSITRDVYKKLVKEVKKEDAPKKIKAADNGRYYLLPGAYTVELEQKGKTVQGIFKLKAPKKKSRKKIKKTP